MSNIKALAETLAATLAHVMKLSITDHEFHREILQHTLMSAPYIHELWVLMEAPCKGDDVEQLYLRCWKSAAGIQFETVRPDDIQQIEKLRAVVKQEQLTITAGPSDGYHDDHAILSAIAIAPVHLDGVYAGVAVMLTSLNQLAEEATLQTDQSLNHWISSLEADLDCGLILFGGDGKELALGNMGRSHLRNLNDKKKARSQIKQHPIPHLQLTWVVIESAASQQKASPRTGVSNREYQLLPLLALGKTNDEIASTLSISSNTVKNHLDKIFKKIGVNNRHAAAVWWQQRQSTGLFNS